MLWSPELRAQLKLEFWLLASSQPSCRCCATHAACGTAPRRFRPHRRQHQRQRSRTPAAKLEFFKAQLARARLPPVEQKVFDATNSDAWGPHGTVLGEIARCTASPDERAQVLSVLWRRVAEDKPDQWRCVYKALAVLEYLVANGSEAVVDELCNLAPRRLASLSGFQYKDTDGKDQVRGVVTVRAQPGAAAQLEGSASRVVARSPRCCRPRRASTSGTRAPRFWR